MKIHKEEEQALKIIVGGRTETRGRGRGRGKGRGRQSRNKEPIECYKCHKLGHYQNEYPSWEEGASYAEYDDETSLADGF